MHQSTLLLVKQKKHAPKTNIQYLREDFSLQRKKRRGGRGLSPPGNAKVI